MRDLATLVIALETDPKYDADVRGGHNGVLVRLLNTEDARAPKRRKAIPAVDFVAAMTSEPLSVAQHESIRTYLTASESFPMHKPAVRAWFKAQGFSAPTVAAIDALSEMVGKPADAFLGDGEFEIGLKDVRLAVDQVAKSYKNSRIPTLRDPTIPVSPGIVPTDPSQINPADR